MFQIWHGLNAKHMMSNCVIFRWQQIKHPVGSHLYMQHHCTVNVKVPLNIRYIDGYRTVELTRDIVSRYLKQIDVCRIYETCWTTTEVNNNYIINISLCDTVFYNAYVYYAFDEIENRVTRDVKYWIWTDCALQQLYQIEIHQIGIVYIAIEYTLLIVIDNPEQFLVCYIEQW